MKNKKLEKLFVKSILGGLFAFVVGIVYTTGKHVEEDLDESYEKNHGVPKKLWS